MRVALRYVLALSLLAAPTFAADEEQVPADHITERDRLWVNYNRESAVVGSGELHLATRLTFINKGSRDAELDLTGFPLDDFERLLEIQGTPDTVKSVEGTRFDLRGAYGLGSTVELGFDLPIIGESIKFDSGTRTLNTEDLGDLVLYAKFRKMVASGTSVGGGLEISTPTGSERKRLGTGELAFNPFVNIRHTIGRFATGGHMGFNMAAGDVPDVWNYSAFAIAKASENLAFRVEINGRFFRQFSEDFNDVSVWPGLDFAVSDRITLRPQASVGITRDAYEWSAGIGILVDVL